MVILTATEFDGNTEDEHFNRIVVDLIAITPNRVPESAHTVISIFN